MLPSMAPSGKIVLVVDDDALLRESLAAVLKQAGYTVHEAENGLAGLAQAAVLMPQLILLDMHMPEMDGITMLRTLRGEAWGKNLKVGILSSDTGMDAVGETVALDVCSYVDKTSFSLASVVAEVKKICPL
jgi:CheY-like chemotaxis protein